MEIIIQPTPRDASRLAAHLLADVIRRKPRAVIGLATGNTPMLLYRELIAMKLDWRRVTTFNLDEYVGLAPEHPQSFHSVMWANLFRHVNIARKNVHLPDGRAADIPKF
jgi:glucosamine-6-phosphate deaminase